MALDKLVDSAQLDSDLASVANAIRTKGGTSASLSFPQGFVDAVEAIQTGGGLPAWIAEMDVQTFSPATDTNEELMFMTNLQHVPDLILIISDFHDREVTRDFAGGVFFLNPGGFTAAFDNYAGYEFYGQAYGQFISGIANPTSTNPTGIMSASASAFTVKTPYYGGGYCYWRANHTYTIIAIKTKAGGLA